MLAVNRIHTVEHHCEAVQVFDHAPAIVAQGLRGFRIGECLVDGGGQWSGPRKLDSQKS